MGDVSAGARPWFELCYQPEQDGNEGYYYLVVTPEGCAREDKALGVLGMFGVLPPRDTMLKQLVGAELTANGVAKPAAILQHFDALYCSGSELRASEANYSAVAPTQSDESVDDLMAAINSKLVLLAAKNKQPVSSELRGFYINLLQSIIAKCSVDCSDDALLLAKKQALKRIDCVLQKCDEMSYPEFLQAVNLIMDEFMLLMAEPAIELTAATKAQRCNDVVNALLQFSEKMVGERPSFATLANSGMQAITMAISRSIDVFKSGGEDGVTLCMGRGVYFEAEHAMNFIAASAAQKPVSQAGKLLRTDGKKAVAFGADDVEQADDVIVDVYVGSFENNVNATEAGYEFNDINAFVSKQLALRAKCDDDLLREKPLVVIVDNTMSSFDDTYLPWLLTEFEEEIETGQLAVVCANSLNKQFHMGTDKTPLGLMATYAKSGRFSALQTVTNHELENGQVASMSVASPTIKLTTTIMEGCAEQLNTFYDAVRMRARYLYDKVLPKTLQSDSGEFIQVDSPVAVLKSKSSTLPKTVATNTWPFMNIRINAGSFAISDVVVQQVSSDLYDLLGFAGIVMRDGYGLSETVLADISDAQSNSFSLRLSMGTESVEHLSAIVNLASNYMLEVNALMKSNKALLQQVESGQLKSVDVERPLIHKLTELKLKYGDRFRDCNKKDDARADETACAGAGAGAGAVLRV